LNLDLYPGASKLASNKGEQLFKFFLGNWACGTIFKNLLFQLFFLHFFKAADPGEGPSTAAGSHQTKRELFFLYKQLRKHLAKVIRRDSIFKIRRNSLPGWWVLNVSW
jgi:hypothetical protein